MPDLHPCPADSWFSQPGPDYDVAISTRIRLSRNLADIPFSKKMNAEQSRTLSQRLCGLAGNVTSGSLSAWTLDTLTEPEIAFLTEEHLVAEQSDPERSGIALDGSRRLSAVFNIIDHLRISATSPGLDHNQSWTMAAGLETRMERQLEYAASIEMGYLSPELMSVGCGLRSWVMLHLPALREQEPGSVPSLSDAHFILEPLMHGGSKDSGFFLLHNTRTFGLDEKEILEKLEISANRVVHYERESRLNLLKKKRNRIVDKVWRAWGIATHARNMSWAECVPLLSNLRLGAAMGILDGGLLPVVTSLFFRLANGHLALAYGKERLTDGDTMQRERAEQLRNALSGLRVQGA